MRSSWVWVVLVAMTMLTGSAQAQPSAGKVIGKVVDAVTGKPVPGASLVLAGGGGGAAAATNSRGFFTIVDLPAGDYRMKVSRDGYTPITGQKVRVNANYTTRMDVSLPNPTALADQKKLDDKKKQDDLLRAQQLAAAQASATAPGAVSAADLPEPAAPLALASLDPSPATPISVTQEAMTDPLPDEEEAAATVYTELPSEPPQLDSRTLKVEIPEVARQLRLEGVVYVQVTVEADGSVSGGKVIRGVPGLEESALDAIMGAHFTPAKQGGQAVATRVVVPIRYSKR